MEGLEEDKFWDGCDLVTRDPEVVHGTPVLKGTRLPADVLVENVEYFMELEGMTEDEAIEARRYLFHEVHVELVWDFHEKGNIAVMLLY